MPFLGVSAIDGMGRLLAGGARDADAGAGVAADRDAGRARRRAARDDQRQRHRGRAAGRRHPDAVRRRSVPRGVRSALPDRGRVRRGEAGDRSARRAGCGADAPDVAFRPARPDGRAPGADARRFPGHRRARTVDPPRAREAAPSSSPARAPTITSTSRASPACRTAWPTGPASSSWRTSRTSIAASTIW